MKRNNKIINLDNFINLDENFLQKVSDSIRMDLLLSLEVTDATWMMEAHVLLKKIIKIL